MSTQTDSIAGSKKLPWTAGLSVALGVPLLIVPSIEYFVIYAAAFSIMIWGISVLEGFAQNMAYGEMAVDHPKASGLPGAASAVLRSTGKGSLAAAGGFCAWGYCLAWTPIPAIFTITIVDLLIGIYPAFASVPRMAMILLIGTAVLVMMFLMNRKGLSGHLWFRYLLNFIALVPLIVIAVVPLATGQADMSNITQHIFPAGFQWSWKSVLLMFGLFGMAQWSACAWETAAIYGPEYQNPKKDTPKALISCGMICLAVYLLIQTSCVSVLGVHSLQVNSRPAMLRLAEVSFGRVGGIIAAFVLIVAMFTIIQTGFAGASRAIKSMSDADTLPVVLGKTNRYSMPQNAMFLIIAVNYIFFFMQDSSTIVAASSIGYSIANGIGLFAYVVHKRGKNRTEGAEEGFSMPKFWVAIAAVFSVVNIPCFFVGLMYLMNLDYGMSKVLVALCIIAMFFPLYFYTKWSKRRNRSQPELPDAEISESA